MTIAPTGTTTVPSLYTTTTPATDAKKEMDQEVFLALLVAQLRNQDPTAPMDTTEMMSQSTQLASMEQLTRLTDTSRESFSLQMRVAAAGMVGQEVTFVDDEGVTHSGVAEAVSFAGPVPVVRVGEWEVPLDAVAVIRAAVAPVDDTPAPSPDPDSSTDPSPDPTTDPAGSAGSAA